MTKSFAVMMLVFAGAAAAHNTVPIKDVQVLTLQEGKWTTGRRSPAVKQLTCLGFCKYAPSSVRCVNAGWDGIDIQWDCQADLDENVKFGVMNVQCEGYDYPGDPNILAGSCGLEYRLESNGEGSFLGSLLLMSIIILAISSCCDGDNRGRYNYDNNPGFMTGMIAGLISAGFASSSSSSTSTSSGYASTSRR